MGTLRLLRYTPLFSGHQVERVPELQFQRPEREIGISLADADRRGIATGDVVDVRSNRNVVACARASTAPSSRARAGCESTPPTSISTSRS